MSDDPISDAWNQLAVQLQNAPRVTGLPREEIIRLCHAFFYVGATATIAPILRASIKVYDGGKVHDLQSLICVVADALRAGRSNDGIVQLLTTLKAHTL